MSNAERSMSDAFSGPRVVFLGMPCAFSVPPLAALVGADLEVAAVVLPGPPGGEAYRWHHPPRRPRPGFSLSAPTGGPNPASVMTIATRAGIPLLFAGSIRDPAVVAEIARLRPDAIAVACFPDRLSRSLLDVPPLGTLNVHPSLLPLDRGPSPLFWVFHRGAVETGVTVHLMEESLDTGPIVRQRAVPIGDGRRLEKLELELATVGGDLLVEAILARAAGDLSVRPQDSAAATSASFPTPADAVIDPATWSARRAYRFVRGVRSAAVLLPGGDLVPVNDGLWLAPPMPPGAASEDEHDALAVTFDDGTVTFRRAHSDHIG